MQDFHDHERATIPKGFYDPKQKFQPNQLSDKKNRVNSSKYRNKTIHYIPNQMELIPQSMSISINDESHKSRKNSDHQSHYRVNKTLKKKNSNNFNEEQLQTVNRLANFTNGNVQANIYNSTVISGQQPTLYKIANSYQLSKRKKQPCSNHSDKKAQFILFHGKNQTYICEKCAASIITKDYSSCKLAIDSQNTESNYSASIPKSVVTFGLENIDKLKWEKDIRKFLNQMSIVRQTHIELLNDCVKIQQIYQEQIELLDNFYTTLIETISHYRNQHLKGFKKECNNIVKQYEKETLYLTKAMKDIDSITQDVRINIDNFLSSQSEREFKGVMEYYENTLQILNRKAQSISSTVKIYPQFKEEYLESIVHSIQLSIQDLISSQNCNARSLYTCIKPLSLKIKQFSKTKKAASLLSAKIQQMNSAKPNINSNDHYRKESYQQQQKYPTIRIHSVLPQEIQRCRSAQNLAHFQKYRNGWQNYEEAESPHFKKQ